MNMEVIMTDNTVTDLSEAIEAIVEEVAINIISENDGRFDLTSTAGIQAALDYAVDSYDVIGVQLNADDVGRVLRRKLKALHELNLT